MFANAQRKNKVDRKQSANELLTELDEEFDGKKLTNCKSHVGNFSFAKECVGSENFENANCYTEDNELKMCAFNSISSQNADSDSVSDSEEWY